MQVRMMDQALPPGVEYGEETDLGPQMLGIGGNGAEGFGRRSEEKIVEFTLVLESDGRNGLRDSKDQVEILDWQEFGAPIIEPLRPSQGLAFGTMPIPARVVGVARIATEIAGFLVAPERRGPTGFDGVHDATLREGKRIAARTPVGVAVATKDVRHFKRGSNHCQVFRNTEAWAPSE